MLPQHLRKELDQGTSRFLCQGGGGGGGDAPPWLCQGGHFEVKEGHPDFLQIT